MSYYTKKAKDR